jgi:hypothetical protein
MQSSFELNSFVKAVQPEIPKYPIASFTPEQAEQERLKKGYLVRDIFMHLGPENHMKIVALLKKKCFPDLKDDEVSRHIMHRVMNGTMINKNLESDVEFIYDMHDRAAETIMAYIAFADSMENAQKIIESIHVDLENF